MMLTFQSSFLPFNTLSINACSGLSSNKEIIYFISYLGSTRNRLNFIIVNMKFLTADFYLLQSINQKTLFNSDSFVIFLMFNTRPVYLYKYKAPREALNAIPEIDLDLRGFVQVANHEFEYERTNYVLRNENVSVEQKEIPQDYPYAYETEDIIENSVPILYHLSPIYLKTPARINFTTNETFTYVQNFALRFHTQAIYQNDLFALGFYLSYDGDFQPNYYRNVSLKDETSLFHFIISTHLQAFDGGSSFTQQVDRPMHIIIEQCVRG
jgi:hypothetical protein